jgi:hypothetical protein
MSRPRSVGVLALAVLLLIGGSWLLGLHDASAPATRAGSLRDASSEEAPRFATGAVEQVEMADPDEPAPVATPLEPPDDSTVIAGRVIFTTGEAAPGLRVCAWPPTEPPTSAELALVRSPRSALTDETGRFAIAGLAPDAIYSVGAGGRGIYGVIEGGDGKVAAGTLDVTLTVGRIWGVHLLIRDENGEPPVTNVALRGRGPGYQQPKGCLRLLPNAAPLLEVVGMTEEQLNKRDVDEAILLCLGGDEPPEPMNVGGQIAGYEPYRAQVPLGLLSEGLPAFVVRARRLCQGFGRLTVQCIGTGPGDVPPKSPPRGRDRIWVEMTPTDEESRIIGFSLKLGSIPWRGATFDHIPIGRYGVRLWTEHRFLSVPFEDQPQQDFEVFAGDNLLQFDVGSLGAVELDVRRPDGSAWHRELNVELSSESWGEIQQHATLGGPPYVIDALPVGRYRFHIQYPFAADAVGEADGYVTVDGMRIQRVIARP